MSTRVLHVVSAADATDASPAWLAPLADAWASLATAGLEQLLVSASGGAVVGTAATVDDPMLRLLLQRTADPAQIDAGDFDALLIADVSAVADVTAQPQLRRLAISIGALGGIVAAADANEDALRTLAGPTATVIGAAQASDLRTAAAAIVEALVQPRPTGA